MATRKDSKRSRDSGSNDSVIASRILQDIINNSSETFRAFLQQQMGGGVQAEPLAGGGQAPPSMWGIPDYAPPMQGPPEPPGYAPSISDSTIRGRNPAIPLPPLNPLPPPWLPIPRRPLQGPDSPPWYSQPISDDNFTRGGPPDGTVDANYIPAPQPIMPNTGSAMPNPTEPWGPVYEDGSQEAPRAIPGGWNRPRFPLPQSMSILDLLGIR